MREGFSGEQWLESLSWTKWMRSYLPQNKLFPRTRRRICLFLQKVAKKKKQSAKWPILPSDLTTGAFAGFLSSRQEMQQSFFFPSPHEFFFLSLSLWLTSFFLEQKQKQKRFPLAGALTARINEINKKNQNHMWQSQVLLVAQIRPTTEFCGSSPDWVFFCFFSDSGLGFCEAKQQFWKRQGELLGWSKRREGRGRFRARKHSTTTHHKKRKNLNFVSIASAFACQSVAATTHPPQSRKAEFFSLGRGRRARW